MLIMPRPRKYEISDGDVYSRWTVLDATDRNYVLCRCECGTERYVNGLNLAQGKSKSCGCLKSELTAERGRKRVRHVINPGDVFGRITIIDASIRSAIVFRCECGTEKTVSSSNIFNGSVRSCGCLAQENRVNGPKHTTHGLKSDPLYSVWSDMMRRCNNPENKDWPHYGGRGIEVCDRWHNATLFVTDINNWLGPRAAGMTLDRINNDGNYEPGNVKWSTRKEQANNTRATAKARRKLSDSDISMIFSMKKSGSKQKDIAVKFNISGAHVSRILRGVE